MSETTNIPGAANANSFLGLQSYSETQAKKFFGRDAEIETLTSLVNLNTLTIVFGRSGTGKTSLLNAGVFPRLRKNYCLPFRIRLSFDEKSPELVTQIKNVLKEEIDKYGFKPESYPAEETLWEYFHKEPLWLTVTPILVFDQFEEIFTLAKLNPRFAAKELPAFWKELSDLIENNIPEELKEKFLSQKENIGFNHKRQKTKIVFAFREEYLPEFESIATQIPSLKYSRFRLLPMNGLQANEVITKTWAENISAKEARHIVSYFTNQPGVDDESMVTVEPSLLSQVCAFIDKGRIEKGGGKVSADLLNQYPKETILRSIYEEAIAAANNMLPVDPEQKKKVQFNPVKIFLEEKLITSEGFRNKYNLGGNDESLRPAINELNSRYFIREDDNAVELTHDVIAPVIKSDREKRRKEISLATERKKARKKAFAILLVTLLAAGGLWALAIYQRNVVRKEIKTAEEALKTANEAFKTANEAFKESKEELRKLDSTINAKKKIGPGNNTGTNTLPINPINISPEVEDIIKNYTPDTVYRSNPDSIILILQKIIIQLEKDNDELSTRLSSASQLNVSKAVELENIRIELKLIKKDLENTLSKINELNGVITKLTDEKNQLIQDTLRLRNALNNVILENDELKKQIKAAKNNVIANQNIVSTFDGNLRIQVYNKSTEYKIPITDTVFEVYIIPYKGNNKDVLDDNKKLLFTKDCNGFNQLISKLSGWQKAYFKNGYYYFHDVIKNGKYKVKVCNILDGYFDLQMPSPSGEVYWKQNEKEKIAIKLGRY